MPGTGLGAASAAPFLPTYEAGALSPLNTKNTEVQRNYSGSTWIWNLNPHIFNVLQYYVIGPLYNWNLREEAIKLPAEKKRSGKTSRKRCHLS